MGKGLLFFNAAGLQIQRSGEDTYTYDSESGRWNDEYTYNTSKDETADWNIRAKGHDHTLPFPENAGAPQIAKAEPPTPKLNNGGMDPNPASDQTGKEVVISNDAVKINTPVVRPRNNNNHPVTPPRVPAPLPAPIRLNSHFQDNDSWFPAGHDRDNAYSQLREVGNYIKNENMNQVFYVDIYTNLPEGSEIGGNTQFTGRTIEALMWGRFLTVQTIIRRISGNPNAEIRYVPHFNDGLPRMEVRPAQ